jgi:DNA-binding transcriptional regulator PaaX
VAIDTEADQANTKVLYLALESTSTHLNISLLLTLSLYSHGTVLTFLLIHALVKHFEAKDQFLRVAVKRMTKTQLFEDELKEVSQLNSILLSQKLELETRLAEESQAKDGKHFTNSLLS